jgi:K+/H+ antiporter YhaU regulatory subunit KhtT
MPSPSATTRLFVGDTLVMFGKRTSLETLVARG